MSSTVTVNAETYPNRAYSFNGSENQGDRDEIQLLLDRLIQGDSTAYWVLWEHYKKYLYSICLRQMGGVQADADDALSRVMLKARDRLPRYAKTIINLKSWLTRLTINLCIEIHREHKRCKRGVYSIEDMVKTENEPAAPSVESPERTYLHQEMCRHLSYVIDELPPTLRDAFILRIICEMPYQDIAAQLRLSAENVRKRIQMVRSILQRELNEYRSGRCAHRQEGAGLKVSSARGLRPRPPAEDYLSREGDAVKQASPTICAVQVRLPIGATADFCLALDHKPRSQDLKLRTLRKYIQKHPKGWKKRLELANLLYAMGRWQEAKQEYQNVLKREARLATVWIQLGNMLRLMQEEDEAVAAYEKALALAADASSRHKVTGLIEVCRQHYFTATSEFKKAALEEPDNADHWQIMGLTHLAEDHPYQALLAFDQVLVRKPDDPVALTYSHEALVMIGRPNEAHRRVVRALELAPSNVAALIRVAVHLCNMGFVYGEEGKKTRQLIRKALRLAPGAAAAHESLALYHMRRGEWKEGLGVVAAFTQRHKDNPYGWLHYACWLFRTGNTAAASEAIFNGYRLHPNDDNINRAACEIFSKSGRVDYLSPLLELMFKRSPNKWSIWARAGQAMVESFKDYESASTLSAKAPNLQPQLSQAWFEHGRVLALAGKHHQAIDALEEGWKWLPEDETNNESVFGAACLGEIYQLLGKQSKSRGWWEETVSRAQKLTSLDPAIGFYWRGKALQSLGLLPEALQSYRAALSYHLLYPARQEVKAALNL